MKKTEQELIDDLIKRTIEPCATALKNADLSIDEIDEVVLVGGFTGDSSLWVRNSFFSWKIVGCRIGILFPIELLLIEVYQFQPYLSNW